MISLTTNMKKQVIDIITPLGASVRVPAYVEGCLAVHKIPYTEKVAWSISHVQTGMGVCHKAAPFTTMKEGRKVAEVLLASDSDMWEIEGAAWGDVSDVKKERLQQLWDIFHKDNSVVATKRKKSSVAKQSPRICICGKPAERYMLNSYGGWHHYCLDCQPYEDLR